MSALRNAGTNRPSSVSTAMPRSTCGCRVRVRLAPSNHALSAGTVLQATTIARTRRAVMSWRPLHACRSASSTSVVGTTCACASAITRAMLRRTPLSCSGCPVAAAPGGCVRIGLPACESVLRCCSSLLPAGEGARRADEGSGRDEPSPPAPLPSGEGSKSDPSAAARLTSSMVTVPSAPVAATRAMSTPSLRAVARTAGIALTPPAAIAACATTASPTCIAPTTVPASALAAGSGAGVDFGSSWVGP